MGVAGTIFKILPSKDLAGQLNQAILHRLHYIEFACLFLIIISLSLRKDFFRKRENYFSVFLLLVMAGLLVFYGILLENSIASLRSAISSFDRPGAGDGPAIAEFRSLHKTYTRLVSVNLIAGILLYAIQIRKLVSFR